MFKIHLTRISILYKTIPVVISVVWNFSVLDIVYAADEHSFIYASDFIHGQRNIKRNINSEREIWQYQHEIPLTFQDNDSLSQTRYTYLPPTQKIGSNPISNPQYNYQLPLNNDVNYHIDVAGNIYHYPPPMQKIGSNPFIKSINQYVDPHKAAQLFASSCGCKTSNYQAALANY